MRRRPVPARLFALVIAGALLAGGCSGDDEEDRAALTEHVADDLASTQEAGAITFDREQADCTGQGLVERFGADQVREWGYDEGEGTTPEGDLAIDDGEQREQAWEVLTDCVDVVDQIADILEEQGALDADESACVAERYVDSDVAAHAVFGPGDPEVNVRVDALLEEAVEDCA